MKLQALFAVCTLDLGLRGSARDAKNVVKVGTFAFRFLEGGLEVEDLVIVLVPVGSGGGGDGEDGEQ